MGEKRGLANILHKIKSFSEDVVRIVSELETVDTKYLEEEIRVTITKELNIQLLIASVKLQGEVERTYKVKMDDQCKRIESVRDSAEHDMEDI